MYVVRMGGMKVRMFDDPNKAYEWATLHCSESFKVCEYVEHDGLPRAGDTHLRPKLDFNPLVVRPYVSLA